MLRVIFSCNSKTLRHQSTQKLQDSIFWSSDTGSLFFPRLSFPSFDVTSSTESYVPHAGGAIAATGVHVRNQNEQSTFEQMAFLRLIALGQECLAASSTAFKHSPCLLREATSGRRRLKIAPIEEG